MRVFNLALLLALALCVVVAVADEDVEVIEVDGDGSNDKAAEPDLLPGYFETAGITFPGARVKDRASRGGRRGVVATRDIAEGEVVFEAHVNQLISMGRISRHEDLAKVLAGSDISPTVGLAVLLVYEKYKLGKDSEIYAYVQSLPSAFGGVQYWGEDELKSLSGSPLLGEAQKRSVATSDDYKKLAKMIVEDNGVMTEEEFSFNHFAWAVSTVFSRSLLLSVSENEASVPVLLPGFGEFDLTVENASSIQLDNETIVISSFSGAKSGASIFVNNGMKGNDNLLLNHGTFIEGNPYDSVPIAIRMSSDDPLYGVKERMLRTIGVSASTTFRLAKSNNGTVPSGLVRALRVQLLRGKELDRFNVIRSGNAPVSLYNEALVYRTLLMACEQMLKMYPTTLSQDDAELKEIASAAKDEELKATRPLVGILHRRMEKQILLRTKIWVYEQWSSILSIDGGLSQYLEHY